MRSNRFEWFCAIDWSGAAGERHKGIAVALCDAKGGPPVLVERAKPWSRSEVLAVLKDDLPDNTLVGMDLGIALPFHDCGGYFPGRDHSPSAARELWAMIDRICKDDPHLAAASFVEHPDLAPYFRRQGKGDGAQFRCDGAQHGQGRFRVTEHAQAEMGCKPYSNFNLVGAAQVGKSSLTGMRVLHQLERQIPVWPIDPLPDTGSAIVEIYTTLAAVAAGRSAGRSKIRDYVELDEALAALDSPTIGKTGPVDDHSSDALITAAWLRGVAPQPQYWRPNGLSDEIARTEGWTFGAI